MATLAWMFNILNHYLSFHSIHPISSNDDGNCFDEKVYGLIKIDVLLLTNDYYTMRLTMRNLVYLQTNDQKRGINK